MTDWYTTMEDGVRPPGDVRALADAVPGATPFFVVDLRVVGAQYDRLQRAFGEARIHYAVKCNPEPRILETLARRGSSFEVASCNELLVLRDLGVSPDRVLFSNPVKSPVEIARAYRAGLRRFAFSSVGELEKIAEHAPGSKVYARLSVVDTDAQFPLSQKFGVEVEQAAEIVARAARLGLEPYGLTFHVGSQQSNPYAWGLALRECGRIMRQLLSRGISLSVIDIGGGFPVHYGDPVPAIEDIARAVGDAMDDHLPYPVDLLLEPGRYLVAEAGVAVATVIGGETRHGEHWLYLDLGVFNGLMEALELDGGLRYPYSFSSPGRELGGETVTCTIAGPTCDQSDTIYFKAQVPAAIEVGDRCYIHCAGAYTLSYASTFNGFELPTVYFVD